MGSLLRDTMTLNCLPLGHLASLKDCLRQFAGLEDQIQAARDQLSEYEPAYREMHTAAILDVALDPFAANLEETKVCDDDVAFPDSESDNDSVFADSEAAAFVTTLGPLGNLQINMLFSKTRCHLVVTSVARSLQSSYAWSDSIPSVGARFSKAVARQSFRTHPNHRLRHLAHKEHLRQNEFAGNTLHARRVAATRFALRPSVVN